MKEENTQTIGKNGQNPGENIQTVEEKRREENSYRSIMKGTTIFGGVQIFHVLVSLVRGKLVAMFLGPAGMGVSSLYVSSTATVQKFASLGLNLAIVREAAAAKDNEETLSRVVGIARRLTLATGLLGALVCMLLSGVLSRASFGNSDHIWEFVALGVMVFFAIAGSGELSLLQGVRDVKRLSRATIFGSLAGLLISVPLYYFRGVDGIVPAMIILSLAVYIFYAASSRKIGTRSLDFSWKGHLPLILKLVSLGLLLMSSDLIGSFCVYLIQAFVRWSGGMTDVGLYQSANSLTLQYSGVVFAAMAMDYLPRLSNVASDNAGKNMVVNRQAEIVGYIIAPVAGALILFAPLVVDILLTSEFSGAVGLLQLMGFALMMQGLMSPLGYVTFASDNRKVFFWLEAVGGNVVILTLSVIGYQLFGLAGLGIGAIIDKFIWLPVYYIVNRRLYGIRFGRKTIISFLYAFVAVGLVFISSTLTEGWIMYVSGGVIMIFIGVISFLNLRKMMKIK